MLTEEYFLSKDFTRHDLFVEFVDRMNLKMKMEMKINEDWSRCYSLRDVVLRFRHRTLILFKLILLQKKVLLIITPLQTIGQTLLALLSIIPRNSSFSFSSPISHLFT